MQLPASLKTCFGGFSSTAAVVLLPCAAGIFGCVSTIAADYHSNTLAFTDIVTEHVPAPDHAQVEKAGMTVGMRAMLDKGYDMDELEVRL